MPSYSLCLVVETAPWSHWGEREYNGDEYRVGHACCAVMMQSWICVREVGKASLRQWGSRGWSHSAPHMVPGAESVPPGLVRNAYSQAPPWTYWMGLDWEWGPGIAVSAGYPDDCQGMQAGEGAGVEVKEESTALIFSFCQRFEGDSQETKGLPTFWSTRKLPWNHRGHTIHCWDGREVDMLVFLISPSALSASEGSKDYRKKSRSAGIKVKQELIRLCGWNTG